MTVLLDENPGITLACDQESRNQTSFLRFNMYKQSRLQPLPNLRSFRMVVRGQGGEQVLETGLESLVIGQESIANGTGHDRLCACMRPHPARSAPEAVARLALR